jgi:AraC-like DNA-binding protein
MDAIPLVRVRYADSFAEQLNRLGAPTERLLNQVNLSEEALTFRDGFMPVSQLWRLTALAARYTGIWEMGLQAGLTPLAEHSQFGHNLLFAPTLCQAMTMFCAMAPTELTNAQFRVERRGALACFCGGPVEGSEEEIRQVELYRIGMMVQMIRWAAGDQWHPSQLQLQSPNAAHLQSLELFEGVPVRSGCPEPAVGMSPSLLSLPLGDPADGVDTADVSVARPEWNFKRSITEIVTTHVRGRQGTIRDVARTLDMSVRTLQRRLSEHGLVFSELVDETRVETAKALLQESELPIGAIAAEIGYGEPTHFSRAFKRITGNSPGAYRRQLRTAALV